jgi:hypothetical protein
VWNHELVAYPGLALLAAAGARPLCGWLERRPARAAAMLAAAAALACAGAPALGRAMAPECVEPAAFARSLDLLRPGDEALVVSSPPQWRMIASLAAERRLEPAPLDALPEADAALPSLALVQEPLWNGQAHGWREQSRAAGWVLLRKQLR